MPQLTWVEKVSVTRRRRKSSSSAAERTAPSLSITPRRTAQPWRVTLLHPHGQGFWWLVIEPPLLAILAGIVFAVLVAPGVIEDLETDER